MRVNEKPNPVEFFNYAAGGSVSVSALEDLSCEECSYLYVILDSEGNAWAEFKCGTDDTYRHDYLGQIPRITKDAVISACQERKKTQRRIDKTRMAFFQALLGSLPGYTKYQHLSYKDRSTMCREDRVLLERFEAMAKSREPKMYPTAPYDLIISRARSVLK